MTDFTPYSKALLYAFEHVNVDFVKILIFLVMFCTENEKPGPDLIAPDQV